MSKTLLETIMKRSETFFTEEELIPVYHALEKQPDALKKLEAMEASQGEPAVVKIEKDTVTFMDTSAESPKGRRSLCFDEAAWHSRKEYKPKSSVEAMVKSMGVTLLDEEDTWYLQSLVPVDQKTSSWIQTPDVLRQKGGALFMDRRYDHIFVYHNGAESYYESRGFRAKLVLPLKP